MLLFAGAKVFRGDVDDAVRVDVEGDFDLRGAAACGKDAVEVEDAEGLVVSCEFTLALKDVDFDGRLVVRSGGEDLALLGRDGGVSVDDLGADTAEGLDTKGQRGDVEQQEALDVAAENTALKGCAHGDTFIGVDALEGLFADVLLDRFLDGRDTGRTADHEDLVDLGSLEAGVCEDLTDRTHRRFDEVGGQFVELRSGERGLKVFRTRCICGDERKGDGGIGDTGEFDLRLFRSFLQTLHSHLVGTEVDAFVFLELVCEPVDDALVEVVAAETVVTGRGKDFLDAVAHLDEGDVEGTAAKVVDHDLLVGLFVDAVCESSGGRLVDDTFDLEAGDLTGVLGRLTLRVGEVCGDRDDGFGDFVAEVSLCVGLQLLQDHRGDLLRSELLVVNGDSVVGTHLSFDGRDGSVGVGDGLTLGDLTDHSLAVFAKSNDRRGGAGAFRVRDDDGLAAFDDRHTGVGST